MSFLIAESSFLTYMPILFMFLASLGFVVTSMFATHKLGPKKKSEVKNESFECGIEAQGNARTPFSIKYFLVAILFVLFDVEVIFMYPWAVNFKQLGLVGLIEMFMFMGFLVIGLLYIVKKGALKWD
ncbi:MAG: NADH-quinone oxidoreductase subunit A [Chitinophagaceae bacterium]|jgi:NADH-quinone oxidoreductase subunit A